MFIHVFSHRTTPYRFEVSDQSDFIGRSDDLALALATHSRERYYGIPAGTRRRPARCRFSDSPHPSPWRVSW